MNFHGHDASNEELIAIVRRIDGSGNGTIEVGEFKLLCDPIILKMKDIVEVEDQGKVLTKLNTSKIDEKSSKPFRSSMPQLMEMNPMTAQNHLDENLKIYDNYMHMQNGRPPQRS